MSRFKPRESGNQKGKPKGCRHASTKLRDAIAADLHIIVAALVEKAKQGDTGAAALLFSRTLPPLRPQSEPPEIVLSGETLTKRAEVVTAATLAGELSPTAATELMALLAQQARIVEVGELSDRLERIENVLKLQGKAK
jgi:hypothetical protein